MFKKSSINMCEGPLLKNIIIYTLPIILTGVLQLLFNAADLIVVGQFSSGVSVGAVGATGALINLIVNLFLGLSVGAGVAVAQNLGAKNDRAVSRAVHTAIPISIVGGILMTAIGFFGAHWFLQLMDTPDTVIGLSTIYMKIYFCGMLPSFLYNFGAAILRAAGDTRNPLIFLTIAGVLNVILNLIFVIVFHMDVAGVALATVLSQVLSAVLILRALVRRSDACRLIFRQMRFHRDALLQILRIGLSAGIQGSIFSISNVLIQSSVNSFGDIVMSGNAAAANIEGFVYTSMNAFHQTALNFIGQNMGARKYRRVDRVLVFCLILVVLTGLVLGTVAITFARPLLSLYTPDTPEAFQYGIIRMSYVCAFYFTCGAMDVMTGAMRGMGYALAPMLISIFGVCGIRITWIYTIFRNPAYHSLESLYVSYPVSWVITFSVQMICFLILRRRVRRRNPLALQEET